MHEACGVEVEGAAVNVQEKVKKFIATVEVDGGERVLVCSFEPTPQAALAVFRDVVVNFLEAEGGGALLEGKLQGGGGH